MEIIILPVWEKVFKKDNFLYKFLNALQFYGCSQLPSVVLQSNKFVL